MQFADRREAGKLLAHELKMHRGNAVIYALPRGGVETGVEVARLLKTPLDLIISRKIGHPYDPEYAIGAVTGIGPPIWNEREISLLGSVWLKKAEADERAEALRSRKVYLADRERHRATGKTAIIVDDGIATGLTMLAAVNAIKKQEPDKIIVAVPVAPQEIVDELLDQVDEVITVDKPKSYRGAVGLHYESFPQLDDKEVIELLEEVDEYLG
jgi:putative phosphoribosyl transferase